ncbi:hypothetical protein HQN90_17790 [Paenibacillus alba]|uniref:hypothetical protein n=1 Tax=Paenibacillus alba TaxID=1197127 RepID=UPI001563C986|nr:hypothetical protein [Paenibacillus alba]NQX67977.1 hypothetical protein [Paenibacillus alba]
MSKKRKRVLKGANYFIEDDGGIPAIFDIIKEIRKDEIIVGVFGSDELVKKAAIHEYGAVKAGIPERSFLRAGLKKYKSTISKTMQNEITGVIEGDKNVRDFMEIVGQAAMDKVLEYFDKIKDPPLLPVTISRKKGSSAKPLIDTKELHDAIRYEVNPKK